jgi:hypothetical protein
MNLSPLVPPRAACACPARTPPCSECASSSGRLPAGAPPDRRTARPPPVQNGYLLRRGGGQHRWHSLVNYNHGDSSSSRFRLTPSARASSAASSTCEPPGCEQAAGRCYRPPALTTHIACWPAQACLLQRDSPVIGVGCVPIDAGPAREIDYRTAIAPPCARLAGIEARASPSLAPRGGATLAAAAAAPYPAPAPPQPELSQSSGVAAAAPASISDGIGSCQPLNAWRSWA